MAKQNWPADKIVRRKVAELIPYARNARTHSEEQVAQIAASIREWGWTNPVLIDEDGTIIAGHGRILAAQQLGIKDAPCMVAAGWSDAQRRAYIIADNKLALNAGWDSEMLSAEFGALQEAAFDLSLTGFDDSELADLLADKTEGLTDPDAVPDVQDEAVSVPGDTWLLGKHRLRCGDSTDANDVAALLAGVEPHLMVTDPPYGVNYDPEWRVKALQGGEKAGTAVGKVKNDDRADWRDVWALFPGDIAYVWHGGLHAGVVYESLEAARFIPRAQIVWVKTRRVISRGAYHWQHEPCLYAERGEDPPEMFFDQGACAYAVRVGKKANWNGDRKQSTVWFVENFKSGTGHGTQKPVECMRRPIVNNSSPGQAVYDPFIGSGTTIIAAEMEGRCAYGMELHPPYVDVCIRRWQDFTGEQATLEGDGRTFGEIEEERCKAAA